MHCHLEVIMPPTKDIEGKLDEVLKKYSEHYEDEEGEDNQHAFYDYYIVGGRYSGSKLESMLGKEKIQEFYTLLTKEKITVSALCAGKERLSPESQIPIVDAMWSKFFPESPIKKCPLFEHYKEDYGDVLTLGELPNELQAAHVIIAGPSLEGNGTLEAKYMIQDQVWNGVDLLDVQWDKKVKTAIEDYTKKLKNMVEDYRKQRLPQDNWLCITIDYHS